MIKKSCLRTSIDVADICSYAKNEKFSKPVITKTANYDFFIFGANLLETLNTVANEIVRTPKKNAVKRKQKDQFCSNWF